MPVEPIKRQRIARACDECRRKKVKCTYDGEEKDICVSCKLQNTPCTHFWASKKKRKQLASVEGSGVPGTSESTATFPEIALPTENIAANDLIPKNGKQVKEKKKKFKKSELNAEEGIVKDQMIMKTNKNLKRINKKNKRNTSDNVETKIEDVDESNYFEKNGKVITGIDTEKKKGDTLTIVNRTKDVNPVDKSKNKEDENNEKFAELFKVLLPGLPNIGGLNVDFFVKIYKNLKKSLIENNNDSNYTEKSIDYLKLATEQYKYYMAHNIPLENITNNTFCLQIALPPKDIAIGFINKTSKECCVLFRFYHRPTFFKNFNALYKLSPMEYTPELIAFLPLCYSTMAVGALFSKTNNQWNNSSSTETKASDENVMNDKDLDDEGYKYFIAARKLIDLTNARDLYSIQTIVMLFIFLQCSARISTCYLFIGVAMRSALREGLHRNIPIGTPGFTILDIEMRKRTFFSIYKMDVYINTMLGLPRTISQQDFDQTFPLEVEDDCITHEGIIDPSTNMKHSGGENYGEYVNGHEEDVVNCLSSVGIANQHTKLLMLLDEIVEGLYPIKKPNNLISHEFVTKLEVKLNEWTDQLPKELEFECKDFSKFSKLEEKRRFYYKANKVLHLSFLQVQILLYRPFIHYLTFNHSKNKYHLKPDELSIKRAENCLEVAKTVISLAKEMMDNHLLSGNYWFSVYTIFFSVAGLIFYIHEFIPTNDVEVAKYKRCVQLSKVGKNILDSLKNSSMAANRTYNLLNILFESLNRKTKTFMVQQHQQQLREEQAQQQQKNVEQRRSQGQSAYRDKQDSYSQNQKQSFSTPSSYTDLPPNNSNQVQPPYSIQVQKTKHNSNHPPSTLGSPLFPNSTKSSVPSKISYSRDRGIGAVNDGDSEKLLGDTGDGSEIDKGAEDNQLNTKVSIEQSLEDLYNMDFNNLEQLMNFGGSGNGTTSLNPYLNSAVPEANTTGGWFGNNSSDPAKTSVSSRESVSSSNSFNSSMNAGATSGLQTFFSASPLNFGADFNIPLDPTTANLHSNHVNDISANEGKSNGPNGSSNKYGDSSGSATTYIGNNVNNRNNSNNNNNNNSINNTRNIDNSNGTSWPNKSAMSITGVNTKNTQSTNNNEEIDTSTDSPSNTFDFGSISSSQQQVIPSATLPKTPMNSTYIENNVLNGNKVSIHKKGDVNNVDKDGCNSSKVSNGNRANSTSSANLKVEAPHDGSMMNARNDGLQNNNGMPSSSDVNDTSITEDPLYLTGIFDQLDMQLFGRFLPPYMSRANNSSTVSANTSVSATTAAPPLTDNKSESKIDKAKHDTA